MVSGVQESKRGYFARILGLGGKRHGERQSEAQPDGHAAIRGLLAHQKVQIVYQPIVSLSSGRVYAYEALARPHAEYFPNPLALFSAAVDADMTGELGRLLRQQAVAQCPDYPLFLNVHPAELGEPFLVRPDDPLFQHPEPIYMEVTESVPLSHFALCHEVLDEVRGKGIRMAVDDLGAGFSNLKYISDLAPEVVKLDRQLVAGVDHKQRQQRLLRSVVRLCQEMGATVVAEGIETKGELQAVRDAGAELGQGFLLARPALPPPDVAWPLADATASA